MDCRREPVTIARVVDEVASMLAGAAAARGMAIVADGQGAEASAWGDPDRIRQVLINLVMNAIKYSPQDAGPITITTAARDGMVELRVKDQGPGIPPHMLEPIFQPFIQLNDRLADRRGGVGLGLAISRELATAMQGRLTVESTVGQGSTFTLALPLAAEPGEGASDH